MLWHFSNGTARSDGLNTPNSVIIPAIREAGVTSKAGFQHDIPRKKIIPLAERNVMVRIFPTKQKQ